MEQLATSKKGPAKVQTINKDSKKRLPYSLQRARNGIHTADDFTELMTDLMTDVLAGDISPTAGNTVCHAGENMLAMLRLKFRFGRSSGIVPEAKVLPLTNKKILQGS